MATKIVCSFSNPPIGEWLFDFNVLTSKLHRIVPDKFSQNFIISLFAGGLAIVELVGKTSKKLEIEWGKETVISFANGASLSCVTNNDVLRALARDFPKFELYGKTPAERTQIDHWLTYSLISGNDLNQTLHYLNKCLAPLTYLVANKLTIADLAVYNEIYQQLDVVKKIGMPVNVQRWYDLMSALACVQQAIKDLPDEAKRSDRSVQVKIGEGERKQEGKFVDLPGAEMGKVIVRFPPEASGYLHIGHAKAALLNQYYQQAFQVNILLLVILFYWKLISIFYFQRANWSWDSTIRIPQRKTFTLRK